MITQKGYDEFISETQAEHKARFIAGLVPVTELFKTNVIDCPQSDRHLVKGKKMNIAELKIKYKLLVKVGEIKAANRVYNEIYELEKKDKKMIKVQFDQEAYYPIEVLIPRTELTLAEAKELVEKLQAEIEIAEWNTKTVNENCWQQNYLESFNEDGLSID